MIIGLCGHARSGKNTVARIICELRPNTRELALAAPIKEFCKQVFGWTDEHVGGDLKEVPDPDWGVVPRVAQQTLGTEWGRTLHEDVWLRLGLRRAQALLDEVRIVPKFPDDPAASSSVIQTCDMVVITDIRFVNEARAINALGGQVWRVNPGQRLARSLSGAAAAHASEAEQFSDEMTAECTLEIVNDGTLERLREMLAEVLASARTGMAGA